MPSRFHWWTHALLACCVLVLAIHTAPSTIDRYDRIYELLISR